MRPDTDPADPEVERLIAEMQRDGVPLSSRTVLGKVESPDWGSTRRMHDWRAYVPRSVRRHWASLPLATRLCVFETAELMALREEPGATLVTGPAR